MRRSSVVALLRDGARRFDAAPAMRRAAVGGVVRGFRGGAMWTAVALSEIRGTPSCAPACGATRLGLVKYGVAFVAAAAVAGIAALLEALWLVPLAVLAFYLAEARGGFAFPAFVDGAADPHARSRELVSAAGGTWPVAGRMMLIALVMLCGGLFGQGFVRSWCIGCCAVVLWYEELRT